MTETTIQLVALMEYLKRNIRTLERSEDGMSVTVGINKKWSEFVHTSRKR